MDWLPEVQGVWLINLSIFAEKSCSRCVTTEFHVIHADLFRICDFAFIRAIFAEKKKDKKDKKNCTSWVSASITIFYSLVRHQLVTNSIMENQELQENLQYWYK